MLLIGRRLLNFILNIQIQTKVEFLQKQRQTRKRAQVSISI
jgi:hypothetical protein